MASGLGGTSTAAGALAEATGAELLLVEREVASADAEGVASLLEQAISATERSSEHGMKDESTPADYTAGAEHRTGVGFIPDGRRPARAACRHDSSGIGA